MEHRADHAEIDHVVVCRGVVRDNKGIFWAQTFLFKCTQLSFELCAIPFLETLSFDNITLLGLFPISDSFFRWMIPFLCFVQIPHSSANQIVCKSNQERIQSFCSGLHIQQLYAISI